VDGRTLLVAIDGRCILAQEDGLGTYARNLLTHLQQVEAPHRFLVLVDPRSRGDVRRLLESDRFELAPLDAPSMKFSQHWRVPRILRARRPDVYHYLAHDMPVVPSVPSVLTFQDLNFLRFSDYYSSWPWLKRSYSAAVCARAVHSAQHILVPSKATRSLLIERWPRARSRVSVVPYGVDPRFRAPIDPARTREVLDRFGLARSAYFLFVGTDRPHKNLSRLWEAYVSLPPEVRERFRLVLAGSHNYGGLRPGGDESTRGVVRLGYVPSEDLPYLYAASFGVVVPSLGEGFGLPALEAMACGAPVLVSKGTALEEVVDRAGTTFDPYSVDSIRAALLAHASSPALPSALSRTVRERAARFDFLETARRTLAIYEQVARGSTSATGSVSP
jgi:alpha-1,3-rhamnosyl/mannosyltransferase